MFPMQIADVKKAQMKRGFPTRRGDAKWSNVEAFSVVGFQFSGMRNSRGVAGARRVRSAGSAIPPCRLIFVPLFVVPAFFAAANLRGFAPSREMRSRAAWS